MLEVMDSGGLATIQDSGRTGFRRFGVPLAGPMDPFAFQAANLLVGNHPGAAALEIGGGDLTLRAQSDCLIAVTGMGYRLSVGDWDFGLWGSCVVRGGGSIHLSRSGFGMWAYVAIPGGFDCPPVLRSRSTYLRGRFGGLDGRPLQPGDLLGSATPAPLKVDMAARTLPEAARPPYGPSPAVDMILGPQSDRFTADDLSAFLSGEYRISRASDRMGYRLEGPALRGSGQSELVSEGMAAGSIQVPAGGQPIVMMADSATAGGYPKIACVTSASLPLLAQCTPAQDTIRFHETSVESAQAAYRAMMGGLQTGITGETDEYAGA